MKVARGSVVRIEYEIRIKGGEVLETSAKSGPVSYVQGEGRMLPALEKRLEGLEAGASLEGEIPAAEASPPEDSLPKKVIPRAEFPKDAKLVVGCKAGGRSARAAEMMAAAGFTGVVDQRAGFDGARDAFGQLTEPGWQPAGLPVEAATAGGSYAELRKKAGRG